jgi:hypothetical protein
MSRKIIPLSVPMKTAMSLTLMEGVIVAEELNNELEPNSIAIITSPIGGMSMVSVKCAAFIGPERNRDSDQA